MWAAPRWDGSGTNACCCPPCDTTQLSASCTAAVPSRCSPCQLHLACRLVRLAAPPCTAAQACRPPVHGSSCPRALQLQPRRAWQARHATNTWQAQCSACWRSGRGCCPAPGCWAPPPQTLTPACCARLTCWACRCARRCARCLQRWQGNSMHLQLAAPQLCSRSCGSWRHCIGRPAHRALMHGCR